MGPSWDCSGAGTVLHDRLLPDEELYEATCLRMLVWRVWVGASVPVSHPKPAGSWM